MVLDLSPLWVGVQVSKTIGNDQLLCHDSCTQWLSVSRNHMGIDWYPHPRADNMRQLSYGSLMINTEESAHCYMWVNRLYYGGLLVERFSTSASGHDLSDTLTRIVCIHHRIWHSLRVWGLPVYIFTFFSSSISRHTLGFPCIFRVLP